MSARERIPRTATDSRDACGIGFLASRQGVAERRIIDVALDLCRQFDHRGAPGHGAGLLLDIPWPLLLDRFPEHARADRAARRGARDVLPAVRARAAPALRGARSRSWRRSPRRTCSGGPTCRSTSTRCLADAAARRTAPVVRQALFKRPHGLSEDGWLACRYLLRLALDESAERRGRQRLLDRQPLEPHGRLQGPRRAVADRKALPGPARRALRLALRAVPQPLQHQHHDRLAARAAVLGARATTARSRRSAATWPGCRRSGRTW